MTRTAKAAERRDVVASLYSQGITIAEIARSVAAPVGTVSRIVTVLRKDGDPRVPYRRPSAAATGFGRSAKPSVELPVLKTGSLEDILASVRAREARLLEELDGVRRLRDALTAS
jgi:hypothetical protein